MVTPAAFTKARTLADKLMASCEPNVFWDDIDALSKDECAALDAIAFECQRCNHWFSIAERHDGPGGQWFCKECL